MKKQNIKFSSKVLIIASLAAIYVGCIFDAEILGAFAAAALLYTILTDKAVRRTFHV